MMKDETALEHPTMHRRDRAWLYFALAVVALIAGLDYSVGLDVGLSELYLVAVLAAAWFRGARSGAIVAGAAACASVIVDLLTQRRAAQGNALYWSAAVHFALVAAVAVIAAKLREALRVKDQLLGELRGALERCTQIETRQQQAEEELRRSNQELEQYSSIAAHDLKSPLVAVSGFLQLLQRRLSARPDPDAERYLGYALEGTARMQALIDDLLAYSRAGVGGEAEDRTDCNVALEVALSNIRTEIDAAAAEVISGQLPTVAAPQCNLVQLFQNLVSNAVKFRGESPPKVSISAERRGREWLFSVSDNGIGIEPGQKDEIFGMFKRLPGQSSVPGTGIGLAICRKVVERLGGRIWVESTPGKGSTFSFTLPDTK